MRGFWAALLLIGAAFGQGTTVTGHVSMTGVQNVDKTIASVFAANFYVSPPTGTPTPPCSVGSDLNNGTSPATPFASATKAIAAARASGLNSHATMLIAYCGGTLHNVTFALNSTPDSGSGAFPVTYTNYPGHTAILSGGSQITGFATSVTGTCSGLSLPAGSFCWQVTLPNGTAFFERLYYNGSPRFRPTMGATAANLVGVYGHSVSPISGTPTCPATSGSNANVCGQVYNSVDGVVNWTSCATEKCEMWVFNKWTASIMVIKTITTGSHTIITTCDDTTCPSAGDGPGAPYQNGNRYQIVNVKELLKFPGQFYYENGTRQLTYISNNGENPNTDDVEVGNVAQPFTMDTVSFVNIQSNPLGGSLQFRVDNYNIGTTGYHSAQLDPNLNSNLFLCTVCVNVNINRVVFANTTANALRVIGATTGSDFSGNVFWDIGGYALQMGVKPQLAVCSGSCSNSTVPNNNTITENWFKSTARFFPSGDDVMGGLSNNILADHNDIGETYDKGFEVCMPAQHLCQSGSATVNNWTVSHNHIHNIGLGVMTDLAGFYASTEQGTGNVLTGNVIHDVNGSVLQNDPADIAVYDIYIDDQTGLWNINNNVAYNALAVAVHMNNGPQTSNQANVIHNNILSRSGYNPAGLGGCVSISCPGSGHCTDKEFIYSNNICTQSGTTHNKANPNQGVPASSSSAIMEFDQNIYNFTAAPLFNIQTLGNSNSFTTWQAHGEDTTGTTSVNPGFVAPTPCPSYPWAPINGVCNDFRFLNGIGPGFGFVNFVLDYGPTTTPVIPVPAAIPTFPEAICQTTAGCSF